MPARFPSATRRECYGVCLYSLDPTQGREQQGGRPVLIISPLEFNEATKLPTICPIWFCTVYNAFVCNFFNVHCIGCKMDLLEIGQLIRKTRKNRKLSQGDLGQQLGMSRATISGIENATVHEIGIRKVLCICAALGLELVAQEKTKRPTLQQLMREQRDA